MKFYNKKKVERMNWTTVIVNPNFQQAKLWCQQNSSRGRFYSGPYRAIWRFEFEDDALAFSLKFYGEKRR